MPTEHITIISAEEQAELCPNPDFKTKQYAISWDHNAPCWVLCNTRAIAAIKKREQKRDFLCLIAGGCQKMISDAIGSEKTLTVEYGIGYSGVFSRFRVYESYAHQAHVLTLLNRDPDGFWYDAVIPNYYDVDDFPYQPAKGNYLFYIGRMITRKGLQVILEIVKETKFPLVMAGQGIVDKGPDWFRTEEGILYNGPYTHIGYADVQKRGELLGGAKAVLVPTVYLEPFGGVNVEAQMCGTPVITSDWGAFPETVEHGKTGWRCRTLDQFVWAAQNTAHFDTSYIRNRAVAKWSLEKVAEMYQEYFSTLLTLWDEGWYRISKTRTNLNWLK